MPTKPADNENIQALHPDPTKTNKKILLKKYELVREHLLAVVALGKITHPYLMEQLHASVKNLLEGNAQWYGETVKLDLEARHIIERAGTKPDKYRLVN